MTKSWIIFYLSILGNDTPTKVSQGQKEINYKLDQVLPALERLNHEFSSLKVDLLKEIKSLKEELLKKTIVDPSIVIEGTTQIKSTPEAAEIDESKKYKYSNPSKLPILGIG